MKHFEIAIKCFDAEDGILTTIERVTIKATTIVTALDTAHDWAHLFSRTASYADAYVVKVEEVE